MNEFAVEREGWFDTYREMNDVALFERHTQLQRELDEARGVEEQRKAREGELEAHITQLKASCEQVQEQVKGEWTPRCVHFVTHTCSVEERAPRVG